MHKEITKMIHNTEKQQEITTHKKYSDFYQKQMIGDFEPNDKIELLINSVKTFEYTVQYNTCHYNLVVQDKSTALMTELEKKQRELILLQAEITELNK